MKNTQSPSVHLLLLSSLITCLDLFSACKKDQPDRTYYIRFKYDDKHPEYTAPLGVYASFEQTGPQYILNLIESGPSYTMKLQVNDYMPIDTGTYEAQGPGDTVLVRAYIDWLTDARYSSIDSAGNAKISFSEITPTTVRGTFSGTVHASGHPDIVLREGEFFLKREN